MEIRCDRCHTEYDLDESRLRSSGVTVKCTACGCLFKVRRQAGAADPPTTRDRAPLAATVGAPPAAAPLPATARVTPSGEGAPSGTGAKGAPWLLRAPSGEVLRFHALTTLQQWIVERRVARDWSISRNGQTWKRLGAISELESFFVVVDQAEAALQRRGDAPTGPDIDPQEEIPTHTTNPRFPPPPAAAPSAPVTSTVAAAGLAALDRDPTERASHARASAPRAAHAPPAVAPAPSGADHPAEAPAFLAPPGELAAGVSPTSVAPYAQRASGPAAEELAAGVSPTSVARYAKRSSGTVAEEPAFAAAGSRDRAVPPPGSPRDEPAFTARPGRRRGGDGAVDPAAAPAGREGRTPADAGESWTGMAAARSDGGEPAWTATAPTPVAVDEGPAFGASGDATDASARHVEPPPPAHSRASAVLATLILLGGAVAAAWFYVKPRLEVARVTPPSQPAQVAAAPDAGTSPPPTAPAPLDRALALIADDTDDALDEAERLLQEARVADPAQDARVLAALALVSTTVAGHLRDDAAALAESDARKAEQLRAEAARRLTRAAKYAGEATAKAPDAPDTLVAAADVGRLSGRPAAKIERLLELAGAHPEVALIRAQLLARERKTARAIALLQHTIAGAGEAGSESIRARWRLALLLADAGRATDAQVHINAILAAQPEHARARALAERLNGPPAPVAAPAAAPAAATPPAPPPAASPSGPKPSAPPARPAASDTYETLVARGNRLSEGGKCDTAIPLFERALDLRANGVEALTGLGYCYLDGKHFVRALATFRAALAASPKFGGALIGMAEAYRFQGLDEEAVLYYRRYLEAHPQGPSAAMARRHVEALAPEKPPQPAPAVPAPAPAPPTTQPPPAAPPTDRLPDKPDAPGSSPPAGDQAPGGETSTGSLDRLPPPSDRLPDRPAADAPPASPTAPAPAAGDPA